MAVALASQQARACVGPVRAALRDATRRVHAALHRAPAFAEIGDPGFSHHRYAALLGTLWRFHASLLPACDAAAAALQAPDCSALQRHRLVRLQRDMQHLAVPLPGVMPGVPALPTTAHQVGALYVALGSTLGGAVLHRGLGRLLPGPAGRAFFAGAPGDDAAWQDFCTGLEAFGVAVDVLPGLIAGAHAGFAHFHTCLEAAA